MRKLAWHNSFRRVFKRRTENNPALQRKILDVLERMAENPFDPQLRTHKLHGRLEGLWASWVEYDCRIVFAFESRFDMNEDLIVLIDLGKHDEVY